MRALEGLSVARLRADLEAIDISDITSWPRWFRWIGIVAVGALILFFGYRYLILPELRQLSQTVDQERMLKDIYRQKNQQAAQLPLYEQQMIDIQDRFGIVLNQLPTTTEMSALLLDISQIGRESGLLINRFTPGNPRPAAFYQTLPISIDVSGTFNQLMEFVIALSSLPRIVHVSDMRIERGGDGLRMQAELATYQYLDPDSQP